MLAFTLFLLQRAQMRIIKRNYLKNELKVKLVLVNVRAETPFLAVVSSPHTRSSFFFHFIYCTHAKSEVELKRTGLVRHDIRQSSGNKPHDALKANTKSIRKNGS